MRYRMLAGGVLLGASVMACGGARAQGPGLEEPPVAVSSGQGGGAEIDTGPWADVAQARKAQQQQHELYEQVTRELGLEEEGVAQGRRQAWRGDAVGGGGTAGGARQDCAEVLAANEPATVVSGTLEFASNGLLTLSVPGQGAMKLHADESTCAVQARRELVPESLLEGTEVRASYVLKDGLPTARVVRAEPVRPIR